MWLSQWKPWLTTTIVLILLVIITSFINEHGSKYKDGFDFWMNLLGIIAYLVFYTLLIVVSFHGLDPIVVETWLFTLGLVTATFSETYGKSLASML